MGLRYISLCILVCCLWLETEASSLRIRRQISSSSNQNSYQPPFLVGAPPPQNPYNPPIPLGRSIDSSSQSGNVVHSSHSISPSAATSYSVHQQPPHNEAYGFQQSSTDTHSKAIPHVPLQAIHKAPASEIQSSKDPAAKDKNNKNEEYVVYYYYYYDNDTTPNNNLSLNFDDIPSLESYDDVKNGKEEQKLSNPRPSVANANSVVSIVDEPKQDFSGVSSSSQPRSATGSNRDTVIRADRKNNFEETVVQPLKPVSNIFRYGANEVPKYPVIPNFIITEVATTTLANDVITNLPMTLDHATTQIPSVNSQFSNLNGNEDDALNNVLDTASETKAIDDKSASEDISTTTTSTTEVPTTPETTTITTTERSSRRRPSIGGGRRRYNASPSSFSSSRTRSPTSESSSSTSSTTSTTTSSPTRRSFGSSNRVRSRPSINTNRGRTGSRTTDTSNNISSPNESTSTTSTTVSSVTSRSRFTSSSPRRFQSSRSRSQSSTSSTSRPSTSSQSSIRSRPTSRRPPTNLLSRSRPARPGFLRPRPGSEPEVTETTTPEPEETSPLTSNDEVPIETDNETSSEDEETSEEPTTTEASRFSALFRPRNRNALGNRPRPIVGNRPSRS